MLMNLLILGTWGTGKPLFLLLLFISIFPLNNFLNSWGSPINQIYYILINIMIAFLSSIFFKYIT